MKKTLTVITLLALLATKLSAAKPASALSPTAGLTPVVFEEAWGYVSMSRAEEYRDDLPLTDVVYFAADVNAYGELISVPKPNWLKVEGKRRHMAFQCDSKSLTHFVLSPEYSVRESIIDQLVKALAGFDGLNVDLELVPARDGAIFLSFLDELRARLPGKILSVCVPARFKKLSDDIYPYAEIASRCDRVFVMAYDEHWSGGEAGPVASPDWCKKVLKYAQKSIPAEKLIMGIPFYGRTWADKTTAGAWYYSGANRIMGENGVEFYTYEKDIPTFEYTMEVKIKGYFNDAYSLHSLASIYKKAGVRHAGYWRIGQEDPEVWNLLKCRK